MMHVALALSIFCLSDREYTPIEEEVSTELAKVPHAWVSHSPYAHEILLLDPENTPLLSEYYEKNKEAFISAAEESLPALFCTINYVLHHEIFTNMAKPKSSVEQVIKDWGHPCIPLEAFLAKNSGVCRHFVFAASYLLSRLQDEGDLPSLNIRIIRSNLNYGGRHAWMQIENWHYDPFWNLIADLSDPVHREFLYHVYGPAGIEVNKFLGETDDDEDDSMLRRFERMGQKPR